MSGRQIPGFVTIFVTLFLTCAPASAQINGSITGVVKDASGAVLPGVTIEVASPALIEKIRTAVSDGQGLYRIVDLRPGTYTVTFTLPGFSTLKRELSRTSSYRNTDALSSPSRGLRELGQV